MELIYKIDFSLYILLAVLSYFALNIATYYTSGLQGPAYRRYDDQE